MNNGNKKISEAHSVGPNIYLNGWVRALFGIIMTFILGTTSYAYIVVIPKLADNVIENDKLSRKRDSAIKEYAVENRVLLSELSFIKSELKSIKDNQTEFKQILRRTAPYERK